MNERIRELIEQAHEQRPVIVLDPETYQPTHKIGNGGVPMYHSELNPEKFAELIVRECVEVLRMVPYDYDGPEFGDEVVYQEAVKKHFGVEE